MEAAAKPKGPTKRTIRAGASFVTTDDMGKPVTKYGGEEIELDDDVAAAHADKLEPLPAVQTSAPDESGPDAEA